MARSRAGRGKRGARKRPVKAVGDPISEMNEKLDRLERKIDKIRKAQEDTEEDVEESLGLAEEAEEGMEKLEHGMGEIDSDLERIEKDVVSVRRLTIGKQHLMELARGTAGAFIGVSVGMGLRLMPIFAEGMEWLNVVAVLVFIFFLGGVLIWKNEKEWIKSEGRIIIFKRMGQLYLISVAVVAIALLIFNMAPDDPGLLAKTLIVGSYPAMAGAITFTIS